MNQHETTLFEIQYCKNCLNEINIYLPHYNMRILSMDNLLSYYIDREKLWCVVLSGQLLYWWFSVGICKYKPGYKSHDLL